MIFLNSPENDCFENENEKYMFIFCTVHRDSETQLQFHVCVFQNVDTQMKLWRIFKKE